MLIKLAVPLFDYLVFDKRARGFPRALFVFFTNSYELNNDVITMLLVLV